MSVLCATIFSLMSLLPILTFVLDKKFQRNASKFAIKFSFCATYAYVAQNEKRKKQLWVFLYIKYGF